MREIGKSSLYRHEVRRAAVEAVVQAVTPVAEGGERRSRLDYGDPRVTGRPRPLISQSQRAIDWKTDPTATVLRRIHAAEGHPGVLDTIEGDPVPSLRCPPRGDPARRPGEILAQRHGAICRATVDGAVWITHLKRARPFKLPAIRALAPRRPRARRARAAHAAARAVRAPGRRSARSPTRSTRGVGYLHFDFYNGAMSTDQCRRLLDAYRYARSRGDERHRADGRPRLLLQRHPPERDRGGRGPGRRSPGRTCRPSTTSSASSSRPTRTS